MCIKTHFQKTETIFLFISDIKFKSPIIYLRTMYSEEIIIKYKLGFEKQKRCRNTTEFATDGSRATLFALFI